MAEMWGTHAPMDMAKSQAVEECLKCHRVCVDTASRSLMIGGELAQAQRLSMLLDCAQICQVSADFILRKSPFHNDIGDLCAEICDRCAEMCLELEHEPLMNACAQACRRCASFCRELVESLV